MCDEVDSAYPSFRVGDFRLHYPHPMGAGTNQLRPKAEKLVPAWDETIYLSI